MGYDSGTRPPHLAALFEQIAATEARIAQLDRELAEIRAGRLLDLPRRGVPDVGAALDAEDTAADVPPWTDEAELPPVAMGRPTQRGAVRPLRQPGRPAKKQGHRRH